MSPSPSSRPFRTEPRTATPERLAALNAREGWSGALAFEPAEKAIERIQEAVFATRARLLSWARHPDERVVLALLERDRSFNLDLEADARGRGPEDSPHAIGTDGAPHPIAEHLARRAVERAGEEGVVWTPVLDKLWRIQPTSVTSARRMANGRWETNVPYYAPVGARQHLMDELASWIETEASVQDLLDLWALEGTREVICRHMPQTSERLMLRVLGTGRLSHVLTNEVLAAPARREVIDLLRDHAPGLLGEMIVRSYGWMPEAARPADLAPLLASPDPEFREWGLAAARKLGKREDDRAPKRAADR